MNTYLYRLHVENRIKEGRHETALNLFTANHDFSPFTIRIINR